MNAVSDISKSYPIVLYDGDCNLCNSAVQFILRHEKSPELRFSPLAHAKNKFPELKLSDSELPDAIHFIHKGNTLIESDAAIAISSYLNRPYSLLKYTKYIPKNVRDFIYRAIAQRRLSMQSLFNQSCNIEEDYSERIV